MTFVSEEKDPVADAHDTPTETHTSMTTNGKGKKKKGKKIKKRKPLQQQNGTTPKRSKLPGAAGTLAMASVAGSDATVVVRYAFLQEGTPQKTGNLMIRLPATLAATTKRLRDNLEPVLNLSPIVSFKLILKVCCDKKQFDVNTEDCFTLWRPKLLSRHGWNGSPCTLAGAARSVVVIYFLPPFIELHSNTNRTTACASP
jgi:hypothetical protein